MTYEGPHERLTVDVDGRTLVGLVAPCGCLVADTVIVTCWDHLTPNVMSEAQRLLDEDRKALAISA